MTCSGRSSWATRRNRRTGSGTPGSFHRSQGHDGETTKKDVINCVDICHFLCAALTQQFLFHCVTVRDEQGNPMESGYAMENEYVEDQWAYIATTSVPSGTCVI